MRSIHNRVSDGAHSAPYELGAYKHPPLKGGENKHLNLHLQKSI
jgi:hypothetical protein